MILWWKEIADLKRRLKETQDELEKEQGKAARLAGFIGRLQTFEVSPSGRIPRREFAEALIDSVHALLKVDQVILFRTDPGTLDLLPVASRGFTPEIHTRLRVRAGEGALGRAAQNLKTSLQNSSSTGSTEEDFFTTPFMIVPLVSQARCVGLLLIAKPEEASFSAEARELAALFAAQGALVFEDHSLYEDLGRLRGEAVSALARAIEAKDSITYKHLARTQALVRSVSQEISLPESLIQQIEIGAFLHDIGKIGIEDSILNKTGPLTPEEYAVMKTHPAIGLRIVQPLQFLSASGAIVLYHQEWYNGAGYPEGLAGEEIPLGARIVQIIDAWDAMTSDRPYRKAMPKAAAITELRRQAGTQFDPKFVEIFLRVIDRLEREGIATTEQAIQKPLASQPA
jgi:HD-GYP domain-containing protein (c-di-GMP phosphodiesterase class II)